jgi:predicted PurR-regulated permease PerM
MRLTIGPATVAIVLAGIGLGLMAFASLQAAHRVLGWAVASAVVAAIVEPIVTLLDRFVPRVLGTLVTLVVVAAVAGLVAFGVLNDLGNQIHRLKQSAPEAAGRLEESPRFGAVSRDLRLRERVEEVVQRLEEPSSGAVGWATSSAGAYFLCVVLVAFLLSWGPRYASAAIGQIQNVDQRIRVSAVVHLAFRRARRYVLGTLGLAVVVGSAMWLLCWLESVPGALAIAVAVAGLSIIPGVGIVVGALPALLLEAGLGDAAGEIRLVCAVLALQIAHTVVLHSLVAAHSLVVGPAPLVIAAVLGFELYGIGGAFYGAVLAVFAVALLDAVSLRRKLAAAGEEQ